jgi:glycosyltransferase involved in cell wall biosynthesis
LAAELSRIPDVRAFSLSMNRYQVDPLSDLRVCAQLARIIRRERFDLIHAHASKPGFLARLAAAGSGVPVIFSPHCFAFHSGAGRLTAPVIAGLERLAAHFLTARILTVSDGERELARQYKVGRDDQFVTIHSGIDPRPFDTPIDRAALRDSLGVPADAPLVGTVGRLNPQKAPLELVRAAAWLHARRPGVHFVWIGSGPLEAAARAALAEHGLSKVFHLVGQRSDIPQSMRALDVFVLSSRWEGFPLVVLEAMAARLPVVATRILGTAEAVYEGTSGLLIPPGDPEQLGSALLDLLDDPARARCLGARGRERVEQEFTRESMLAQVAQVYQEVCERLPGDRPRRRSAIQSHSATLPGSTQHYPLQERIVTAPRREQ